MTLKKKIVYTLVGLICGIVLFTLMLNKTLSKRALSDNFFMVALVFLIIGTFILILSSGFFDLFQKNMKTLISLRKNNDSKEYIRLSNIFKKKPVYWFVIGGTLLIFSIIFAILT